MLKIQNFKDKTTTKTRENTPNGAESTTKRGKLVSKIETNLKKQSQFAGGINWRNISNDKDLRRNTAVLAQKKQSQFKANLRPLLGNSKH